MLTYAGSAITPVNEFMLPRIQRWWDVSAPDLWSFPGYALEGLHHLPVPDRPKPQRARLNVLYWPTGASRWGVFHGLVDAAAATAIQTATGGYGSAPIAADLIIEDPIQDGSVISRTVTASMFLLAVRPVFVLGDASLYWITLVDRRYYYWLQDPTYTFADGDSWADLLSSLATAAGSPSVGTPSVATDYGAPNFSRWNLIGKPLPLLMDAAAKQVGLRYTITLDGASAAYVSYATAKIAADQIYQDAEESKQIVLGGQNAKVLTNATGSALSMIGNVPESVVVKFWAASGLPADYDTETVTLSSLSLTGYSGLDGVPDSFGVIMADQEASVTSPTQADYATQATTDYYNWLLSLNDFVVSSIIAFESSGLEDRIEWEYLSPREAPAQLALGATSNSQIDLRQTRPIRLLTRVVPFDWHDNATYGGGPPNGSSPPTISDCIALASVAATDCLLASIISSSGLCSGVATGQEIQLRTYDDETLWENDEDQFTTPEGEWSVLYDWPDNAPPRMRLVNDGGTVTLRYLGCFENKFRFAGYGTILCGEDEELVSCGDNSFVIELECLGFCAGWYCASMTEDPADCEPLYLESAEDAVLICSGPYDYFGQAYLECGEWILPETGVVCDSATISNANLFAQVVGGTAPGLLGYSFTPTYTSGSPPLWYAEFNDISENKRCFQLWCGFCTAFDPGTSCSSGSSGVPVLNCWCVYFRGPPGESCGTPCHIGALDNLHFPGPPTSAPLAMSLTAPAMCLDGVSSGDVVIFIYNLSNPP